jgi:cytochrome c-type biogenesis protein CcmH/NrfF
MHAVLLLMGMLAVAQDTLPQDRVQPRFPPAVETEASKIFNSTMSPFCPGLLIANCPSPGAAQLKDRVREWLAAGISPDSVRAELYAVYGEQLRATPSAGGFGLLAWLMPGLGLLAGGLGIAWWLHRTGPRAAAGSAVPPLDPEAEARLERELTKL